VRLVLSGLVILFWELVLIRWLGASIRVVAYFSNLVLISAFFGLGVGALATRLPWRLERWIAPLLAFATLLGVWLGGVGHHNPSREDELIWVGRPFGLVRPGGAASGAIAASVLLAMVYCTTALVFVAFGQYLGRLFRTHPPLRAYSLEVGGSLLGILLFALLSRGQASPTVWFAVGFALLVATLPPRRGDLLAALVLGIAVVALTRPAVADFVWSPYYRIAVDPIIGWAGSHDTGRQVRLHFETREEAIAHARKNGFTYTVREAKDRKIKPKAYADNFAFTRREPWTH